MENAGLRYRGRFGRMLRSQRDATRRCNGMSWRSLLANGEAKGLVLLGVLIAMSLMDDGEV